MNKVAKVFFKDVNVKLNKNYALTLGREYQVYLDNYGAYIVDDNGEDAYLADLEMWYQKKSSSKRNLNLDYYKEKMKKALGE